MENTTQINPWSIPLEDVISSFHTHVSGLTNTEAIRNHHRFGFNTLNSKKISIFSILFRQVKGNPLIILLAIATTISYLLGETVSGCYIFAMIIMSINHQ